MGFQYRKRYEITCDSLLRSLISIVLESFNTASGMRSHVTSLAEVSTFLRSCCFNTASGMRSHVTTTASSTTP